MDTTKPRMLVPRGRLINYEYTAGRSLLVTVPQDVLNLWFSDQKGTVRWWFDAVTNDLVLRPVKEEEDDATDD